MKTLDKNLLTSEELKIKTYHQDLKSSSNELLDYLILPFVDFISTIFYLSEMIVKRHSFSFNNLPDLH